MKSIVLFISLMFGVYLMFCFTTLMSDNENKYAGVNFDKLSSHHNSGVSFRGASQRGDFQSSVSVPSIQLSQLTVLGKYTTAAEGQVASVSHLKTNYTVANRRNVIETDGGSSNSGVGFVDNAQGVYSNTNTQNDVAQQVGISIASLASLTSVARKSSEENVALNTNNDVYGFYSVNTTSVTTDLNANNIDAMQKAVSDLGGPEDEGDGGDLTPIPVGDGYWLLLGYVLLYIGWKKRCAFLHL